MTRPFLRRTTVDAKSRLSWVVCATLLMVGCSATYPTTPTPATPLALQLHFTQPLGDASWRSTYAFRAYVIRSDGAWQEVTNQALWSSPDPVVLRHVGSGRFTADNPGIAGVRVQYEGLGAFVDLVVIDSTRQAAPRLTITATAPQTIGMTQQSVVALVPPAGAARDVTGEATWTSSDPSVATVNTGRVTARGPGTTRIAVVYQDLTAAYVFSIPPSQR